MLYLFVKITNPLTKSLRNTFLIRLIEFKALSNVVSLPKRILTLLEMENTTYSVWENQILGSRLETASEQR